MGGVNVFHNSNFPEATTCCQCQKDVISHTTTTSCCFLQEKVLGLKYLCSKFKSSYSYTTNKNNNSLFYTIPGKAFVYS